MTTSAKPESKASAPPVSTPEPSTTLRWGTLLVVLAGTFMAGLDFFIVNVAIPSTQRDLHASPAAIQFVIAGYALAYGAGMITGGRIGDIFGRRKLFIIAMVLFTLTSALCGAAPTASVLIIGRILQGVAAALMAPQVLAILGTAFAGEARAKAINAYGVTMGVSAVLGQLIGGLLIKANILGLDWRACFLINVPIGIVALALTPRFVPESRAPGGRKLDPLGMVLVTLALVGVVLPLIEGREQGWPSWSWVSLGVAIVLFILFGVWESALKGRGGSPLVDMSLFRERAFTAGLAGQVVFWAGQASFFLVFALFVQEGRGMDALQAGLIFIPIGVGYMASSLSARWFAGKMGRQVIALGGVLRLVGLSAMIITVAAIGTTGNVNWLIPSLFVDGAGMGFAVAPLASTVLARITPQHAGSAAGVLTTGLQIGNALGVSLIGVIFYGVLQAGHTYGNAFNYSMVMLLGVALVLVILVQLLPRKVRGQ
jgi:EmrB/QacA subfamily drug resistance transporter